MRRTEWKRPTSLSLSKEALKKLTELTSELSDSRTGVVEDAINLLYQHYNLGGKAVSK